MKNFKFFATQKELKDYIQTYQEASKIDLSLTPVIRIFDFNGNQLRQNLSFSEGPPKLFNSFSTAIKYFRMFDNVQIGVQI